MIWSKLNLIEVADVFNGMTPSKVEQRNQGYPVLKIKDVSDDRKFRGVFESFVDIDLANKFKSKLIKLNDTLILNAAHNADYVGSKQYRAESKVVNALPTGEWLIVRADSNKIDSVYLNFWLRLDETRFKIRNLVKGIHLYPKDVARLKIPLPPLPEQQKIASILDAADSLRQKDQQLIEKYNALSQSLFLEMFGDPETNPMGWTKSIAEKFIDLLTGFAFKSTDYSINKDDINLCGGLIITPTGIEWNKSNYWRRDKCDGLEKYKIIESDIVMAMDRPWISSGFKIHKITKNDKESLLVQRTARIRGRGINQDFLYFLFKHKAFEKQAHTTETTVPHISPKDIRKYELIIPPITLQNQFAERIQYIEAQKTVSPSQPGKIRSLI